jgi:hypothetical protein
MPTFIATSGVIGNWFALPRMPSVPKYRRVMFFPSAPCALFCVGHYQGYGRLMLQLSWLTTIRKLVQKK